jgi:hypothetical protein
MEEDKPHKILLGDFQHAMKSPDIDTHGGFLWSFNY